MVLNQVLVDWLTVKSFRPKFDLSILSLFGYDYNGIMSDDEWRIERHLQYTGVRRDFHAGSVWAGNGLQRMGGHGASMPHSMANITGFMAETEFEDIVSVMNQEHDKFGRIDLQITIEKPEWWNQSQFLRDLQDRGIPAWSPLPSHDRELGKMETVYINKRTSSRLYRIYDKRTDDGRRLLRYEVEYKLDRGNQVGWRVARDKKAAWSILWADLRDLPHRWIFKALTGIFESVEARPVIVGEYEKQHRTESWLLGLVLPTFERHINQHEGAREVIDAFQAAIDRANGWLEIDGSI